LEKPEFSSNQKLALSTIVATIVFHGVAVSAALSQVAGGPPPEAWITHGTAVSFGFLFLPLLWWRHKAGYGGSIALGIWTIINAIIAVGNVSAGLVAPGIVIIAIASAVVAMVLIISSAAAWREKT